jgi:2-aminoadipate transaminase
MPDTHPFTLARRAAAMNPSVIRDLLKLTERPGVLSLAGGLPSAETFPVEAVREACERVLREHPKQALQYAASEGHGPLREWVAAHLNAAQGLRVDASQVLITTGSQQGLDLVGKVLIDAGSTVAVESPTYLGALQAFAPYEPVLAAVDDDGQGPCPQALQALAQAGPGRAPRFAYLLPNFQNPTGRCLDAGRRAALGAVAERHGLPLVEDNPYGDLWFDAPPPPALASLWAEGTVYLGSFSKVLAPGLRLGYVVAPKALGPKLLQAKQAADLHTPIFNQRIVHELVRDGFLDRHVPTIRTRYRAQRDAMQAALLRHLPQARWQRPEGGMFFWLTLPPGVDAAALLPAAVDQGVAFVPGAAFYADGARANTLRLSFVTLDPAGLEEAVRRLAAAFEHAGCGRGSGPGLEAGAARVSAASALVATAAGKELAA